MNRLREILKRPVFSSDDRDGAPVQWYLAIAGVVAAIEILTGPP